MSDILKPIDSIGLDGIPPKYLAQAAERGTRIHEATDDYDFGEIDIESEDWREENADILPYVQAYAEFAETSDGLIRARECALYSEQYGVAGTLDLVRDINGVCSIMDIKTSKTISALRSRAQLNMYRLFWNESHSRKAEALYILQLKDNATYRLIPIDIDEDEAQFWIDIYRKIKNDKKL